MKRRGIVAATAAALMAIGCTETPPQTPPVIGDWHYWVKERDGDDPYWIAALHGNQGWVGANSKAPPISLVVEWEEGDLINVGIMAEEGEFSRECTRNGCYAYVRRDGGEWTVLRLIGVDDEADELRYLSNPWTLYDVLQDGGRLDVDVPLEGRGRCVYSIEASGYSKTAHVNAGPLDRATDEELSEVMEDGRTVKETLSGDPPEWVQWPSCES